MTDERNSPTRLAAMLRRLNVDIRYHFDLYMPFLARAAAVCEQCPHAGECRDWLNLGTRGDSYRTFCRNAVWFDYLPRRNVVYLTDRLGGTPPGSGTGRRGTDGLGRAA